MGPLLVAAPAGLQLVQWLRQAPRATGRTSGPARFDRRPRVTVLVAAWNEADTIQAHVASVRALRYREVEYVLVAGGTDGTYEAAAVAMGGWGILLRQKAGDGKQRALRRGLARASGDVIYLTDGDCVLEDDAFERVVAPVANGAAAATGRSRPLDDQLARRPEVRCQWAPHYVAESRLGDTSPGLLGRNCAVNRTALREAGDFAEDVATGTDYHLARKLAERGHRIAFARDSFVATEMPLGVGAYVRQQRRWLRNHWVHGRASRDGAAVQHAVRTWLVAGTLLGLPLVATVVARPLLWLWLALLAHGAAARVRYVAAVSTAERLPTRPSALLIAPFWFVVDVVAWWLSLIDVVVPKWRRTW